MAEMIRFGVSISPQLLEKYDGMIAQQGYTNRSEAIRDLIRERLVHTEWERGEQETVGTITIVYDHEVRELSERLTEFQHQELHAMVSTMHVHLSENHCLEVSVVKGKADVIRRIAEKLISTKGVRHGKLTMTTIGEELV
ncbi:MAG: nickel-responsive transcriptional regulator NikR [Candidatus Latescibacterota bacterium]